MLGRLLTRAVQSWAEPRHDYLFTPFAPNGAPAQLLDSLYRQHGHALPDEFVPPQHRHYRALVAAQVGDAADLTRLDAPTLKRIYAAYACCFERAETFRFQLAQQRADKTFRKVLCETREAVVADLLAHTEAEAARRAHLSRWKECEAAALDIAGDATLDLIKQMQPDDWHEIVLCWDWRYGVAELNWITSRRTCDRATAIYALCAGCPGQVATCFERGPHDGFVRTLAARLEGGFYPVAELGLNLNMRTRAHFEAEIETAASTGENPWQLTTDLISYPGRRRAAPRYTIRGGRVIWHYEYWLAHLAPPRR